MGGSVNTLKITSQSFFVATRRLPAGTRANGVAQRWGQLSEPGLVLQQPFFQFRVAVIVGSSAITLCLRSHLQCLLRRLLIVGSVAAHRYCNSCAVLCNIFSRCSSVTRDLSNFRNCNATQSLFESRFFHTSRVKKASIRLGLPPEFAHNGV